MMEFVRKYRSLINTEENFRNDYLSFLSKQSSAFAIFFVNMAGTLAFIYLLIEGLRWNPLSIGTIIRMFRVFSVFPAWVLTYYETQRWQQQRHLFGEAPSSRAKSEATLFWSNLTILTVAVSGGAMLIHRSIEGECEGNQPQSVCNPDREHNGLPADTLIAVLITTLVLPVVLKAHDMEYSLVAFIIACVSTITSLIISKAVVSTMMAIVFLIAMGFCLHDYEQTVFNLYLSAKDAKESHEEALRTAIINKSTQEENEQLCVLMGNVAHDLKTPLQSFMADIDMLTGVVNTLFNEIDSSSSSRSSTPVTQNCQTELSEIVLNLQNTYSFMMIAINRGEDFRKATAGIALQARQDTFHFVNEMKWSVSRMMGAPTAVVLRIAKNLFTVATGIANKSPLCPMIISDKHWFCENILSLVSNALKYTVSGSVEVEYRLAALVAEDALPVVVHGFSVQDWFVTIDQEQSELLEKGSNIRESCDTAAAIPLIAPSTTCVETCDVHPSASLSSSSSSPSSPPQLYLLILVHDTGIGIPAEKRRSLFQSFRQAQRNTGGTGLGLFSVAKRMEALGGHCGVHDREDGQPGCSFWMAYPYRPDWSAAEEATAVGGIEQGTITNNHDQRPRSSCSTATQPSALNGPATGEIVSGGDIEQGMVVAYNEEQPSASVTPPTTAAAPRTIVTEEPILSVLLQNMLREQVPSHPLVSTYPLNDPFWRSVLLVEDSPMILKTLNRLFIKEGFNVEVAQNGAVGLEKMKEKEYVLVITDIQMPIMDGHEMTKRFRAHEETYWLQHSGSVPNIASIQEGAISLSSITLRRSQKQVLVGMSANSTPDIERRAQENGMNSFLPKPVLKAAIKECLLAAYVK